MEFYNPSPFSLLKLLFVSLLLSTMDRPELTHALAVAGQVAESVFQDVNVVEVSTVSRLFNYSSIVFCHSCNRTMLKKASLATTLFSEEERLLLETLGMFCNVNSFETSASSISTKPF